MNKRNIVGHHLTLFWFNFDLYDFLPVSNIIFYVYGISNRNYLRTSETFQIKFKLINVSKYWPLIGS